jgi:4-alpha-glucanotransferase
MMIEYQKKFMEVVCLKRSCGILLPLSSLPDGAGCGDLGEAALRFVDFLVQAGQSIWQVLPLSPTEESLGNSPYSSPSAFAGNTLYISLDDLVRRGLLSPEDLGTPPPTPPDRVDYGTVEAYRDSMMRRAFRRFVPCAEYTAFVERERYWLEDYTLFKALKVRFCGRPWNEWPDELRRRNPGALRDAASALEEERRYLAFGQFLFFSQLGALRRRCETGGVELVGDLPIYVHYDSADVWSHPEYFLLGEDLLPTEVAGVPPDYFSETGQLWGNPLYRWDALQGDGFSWWVKRLRHALSVYHTVRIDHFRGLVGYWAVPAGETTAQRGVWRPAPFYEFFEAVRAAFPELPFLAENLGIITPDVQEAISLSGLPGMAVLLFAFEGPMRDNPHAPHNHVQNLVVYSGTHDNDTALGWFRKAPRETRDLLGAYTGRYIGETTVVDAMVRLTLSSVADRAVIPLQDHLGLGGEARMNTPSVAMGNWAWRAPAGCLTGDLAARLKNLAILYGRF